MFGGDVLNPTILFFFFRNKGFEWLWRCYEVDGGENFMGYVCYQPYFWFLVLKSSVITKLITNQGRG